MQAVTPIRQRCGVGRAPTESPLMTTNDKLKHPHSPLSLVIFFLFSGIIGCREPERGNVSAMKPLDNTRLQWCIRLIESGKVHRGMDTNSLATIFGESLDFYHEGKAYSFLSAPPKGGRAGVQLPSLWK